ncbi:MAG: Fur family transcriptional regulator [Fimbriimonadaceae bacterium]
MMKERRKNELNGSGEQVSFEDAKAYEDRCLKELRNAGYRITMPRVQVIRALGDSLTALSAYEIHEKIISSRGKIDVVSVYRILNTLLEVGLIHHIGVVDGYFPSRLQGARGKSQHLVCDKCGNVMETRVPLTLIDAANDHAAKTNFTAEKIKIEVVGKCSNCQSDK